MALGPHCLYDASEHGGPQQTAESGRNLVDVVAVHDVCEDPMRAWIDPKTGVNWLQDYLPKDLTVGRVITYGYDAEVASFFSNDGPERTQRMAESLVQELRADRRFHGTLRRPIIFICHGLGGVLVKKSLIYSSTRTAPKVVHLWDQFVSTFAILFFGTPHGNSDQSRWVALEKQRFGRRPSVLRASQDSHALQVSQAVETEFAPLVKQFHMFFFWENLPTLLGSQADLIVPSTSAAPRLDNTEAAGIHASHSAMVKFGSRSSDYRTVVAALENYCEKAPSIISHRWRQADAALRQMRASELWELGGLGFDVRSEEPYRHTEASEGMKTPISAPQHFYAPKSTAAHFVGRQDLLQNIRGAFFPPLSQREVPGRKSFAVYGMGGSGKTELCSKYAEDMRHRYKSVFTIRAASKDMIKDSFCRIGEIAQMEPTETAGRHFLSQLSGPWLLIIDNADDRFLDLSNLFPSTNTVHILITTRCPDFRSQGTLGYLELKGLKEEEALQLLFKSANIAAPWDGQTTTHGHLITSTLGYLALAVIQAGNCIFRGVCQLGEYISFHHAERDTLQQTGTKWDDQDEDVKKREYMILVVYATFDLSWKILSQRPPMREQDASDLFGILSFFHFENIPIEIFSRAVSNRVRDLEEPDTLPFIGKLLRAGLSRLDPPKPLPSFLKPDTGKLDNYRVRWAISELQSQSLITFDGQYISLHPLIYAWARDRLQPGARKTLAAIAFNTLMESISLPPEGSPEKDGAFHREILPHLEACLAENEELLANPLSGLSGRWLQATKILQITRLLIIGSEVRSAAKCGYVYVERGVFEKARCHFEKVVATLLVIKGEDDEKTIGAMRGLAAVYWGLGRLGDAISLQRTVVNTHSRLYGAMHMKTLETMNSLGQSYWLQGMYVEALELQQTTANRMKDAVNPDDPGYPHLLTALDNLGVTLGAWQRYEESLSLHMEVLEARIKLFGEVHLQTLDTKASLAMALLDLGDLESSKAYIQEVYAARQIQLGKEHPYTLLALCYLSKVLTERGDLEEAEHLLIGGIEAGKRSLSENHLGVLMGRGQLARVYARQGRLDEAEVLLAEVLQRIEVSRGPSHPDCIYALLKSAHLYILKRDQIKAIRLSQVALGRATERLTALHPLSQELENMLRVLRDPLSKYSDWDALVPKSRGGNTARSGQVISVSEENLAGRQPGQAPLRSLTR